MSNLSNKIVALAPVPAIINLIADANTATGWLAANGGATLTTTQAAGDLPLGPAITTAIKITSGTSARAEATLAETNSYAFTTPAAYAVKTGISFWMRPGTNFINSEWTVSVYAGSTRQALTTDASSITYIPNANGKFTTYFDAVASTAYTLRFTRTVNAGGNAAVLNLASVIVGPGIQPQGAIALTQKFNLYAAGSTYSFVSGNNITSSTAFTSSGDSLCSVSAASAAMKVTALANCTVNIDWSLFLTNALARLYIGKNGAATGDAVQFSARDFQANDAVTLATSIRLAAGDFLTFCVDTGNVRNSSDIGYINVTATGSTTANLAQNDVEYAYNTSTADSSDNTSFGYGPGGVAIGSYTTTRQKRVQFLTPIQATDTIVLEVQNAASSTNPWVVLDSFDLNIGISPMVQQNSTGYGFGLAPSLAGSTYVTIIFGHYAYPNSATYAAAGAAWSTLTAYKWRVKKFSGGQAVGFGAFQAASSTNPAGISGLVPAAGLPGRTDGVAVPTGVIGERINSTSLSQTATVTANTAVDVSGSALPLTPGVWLVYFMGLFRIRNLSVGALSVSGAIQLVTNAGVFAGGMFEVAGLQTLTGADTSFTASFAVPIVVAANTTYKLQVINSASAATSIAYFSIGGTFGNDGSPLFYGLRIG